MLSSISCLHAGSSSIHDNDNNNNNEDSTDAHLHRHKNRSPVWNSSSFSVHLWFHIAFLASQQRTSPIGFLFWNFRHRLVRFSQVSVDVKMRRCEDGEIISVDFKMRRCEDVTMICVDLKKRGCEDDMCRRQRCEDAKMISVDVKMWGWYDMRRCGDEKIIPVDVKMRRREDGNMKRWCV